MENKERYFKALKDNNGKLNEIDLGEKIGLLEDETREIIAQLLCEYSIEYCEHKVCQYKVIKKS